MNCQDARPLIPGYLDAELSEAQAGPLRKHLLGCAECRSSAQDGKALKDWFVDEAPVAAPDGFAARIARRAFAGDQGGSTVEPQHSLRAVGAEGSGEGEGRILSFVLQLTAAAAALLLALSIGARAIELPNSRELHADDASKDWVVQQLEELNEAEEAETEEESEE